MLISIGLVIESTRNYLFDNVIEKIELLTNNARSQSQPGASTWMSSLKSATYEWAKLKAESAPRGEIICIWVLGAMTIFSLIAVNQGGLFRDILVLFFSLTIIYLCALIKDLNQNYGGKNFREFLVLLKFFKSNGFKPYLPQKVIQNKLVPDVEEEIEVWYIDQSGKEVCSTITPVVKIIPRMQKCLLLLSVLAIFVAFYLKHY